MAPKLPETKYVLLSVPAPHVLLVTINLAKQMNALPLDANWEMDSVWKWMDKEPELRVGVVTGAGNKAFSSGMDLKERGSMVQSSDMIHPTYRAQTYPLTGFGGLTRRVGRKPIISAVNGHAHGGGFELALNSDLVLAAPHATFRLPDVLRGTAAMQGAFPRLCRTFGLQRANLIALTGYSLSAEEAHQWGLVCKVVEGEKELVDAAVDMAKAIASASPDSVVVSRMGVREAWETPSVERSTQLTFDAWGEKLLTGENWKEGLKAFSEKREPQWKPSKL